VNDLLILLSAFGCTPETGVGTCPGDVDGNGETSVLDLLGLLSLFGLNCTP